MKIMVLFMLVTTLSFSSFLMGSETKINNLKVAYIYQFTKYVNWTEEKQDEKVFNICVHKDSKLQEKLSRMQDKPVKNKIINVISISNEEKELSKCKMLVLPKLEKNQLEALTKYASKSNILTISDTPGYGYLGVMINLVVLNNKIKFEVNLDEVHSTDLVISSSLLKLARIVKSEDK